LRALGDHEFPMPSNIAGIARTRTEPFVDVAKTVPPRKKINLNNNNNFGSKHIFYQLFWGVIFALIVVAGTPQLQGTSLKWPSLGLKPHQMKTIHSIPHQNYPQKI